MNKYLTWKHSDHLCDLKSMCLLNYQSIHVDDIFQKVVLFGYMLPGTETCSWIHICLDELLSHVFTRSLVQSSATLPQYCSQICNQQIHTFLIAKINKTTEIINKTKSHAGCPHSRLLQLLCPREFPAVDTIQLSTLLDGADQPGKSNK